MYQKFIKAITWNSINVFLYKSILLLHQIVLFHFIPKALYGTSGTIFSSIYLLIGVSTLGFDYALFALFSAYIQSKKTFRDLVAQYIIRFIITVSIALIIAMLLYSNIQVQILNFFQQSIPYTLIPIVLTIFITESMRKSIETAAQLLFLNQAIACIQVSMILLYAIMVWASYLFLGFISLYTIFIPMLIISTLETMLTTIIIYNVYKKLPEQSSNTHPITHKSAFIQEQLFNYINQTAKNLFSPNFLMVFVAYNLGMTQAGYIRFFTNIITLLYMFLTRSIGVPTGALFSKLLSTPFSTTRSSFIKITNTYIQVLYFFAITIIVTILPYLRHHAMTPHILLFIAVGFVEYITITYEKLFVVQKHSKNLAIINTMSIALLFLYLYIKKNIALSLIILPILLIRISSAVYIGYYAFIRWKVAPTLMIKRQTVLLSLASIAAISLLIKISQYYY